MSFTYNLALPASLLATAKSALGVNTIQSSGSFAVDYSGGANGTLTKDVPLSTYDLSQTGLSVVQTVSGKIDPAGAGQIKYRPGVARLALIINATGVAALDAKGQNP